MTHVKGGALRLLLILHEREKGFFAWKLLLWYQDWMIFLPYGHFSFVFGISQDEMFKNEKNCRGEMPWGRKVIPSKYKCLAFMYFFSCLNPIIYGFMSRSFRESFISDLKHCCCRSCKKRDDSRESSPREIHNIGKVNGT